MTAARAAPVAIRLVHIKTKMPRKPGPVRPRRSDERKYEALLRRAVLDPLFRDFRAGLVNVAGLAQALQGIDAAAYVNAGRALPVEEIAAALSRVEGYHRTRLIRTFKSALGVDIRPFLSQPAVETFMAVRVEANVSLIRTIPPRAHAGLRKRLIRELTNKPFDRQSVTKMLTDEYRVSGYNVRRLARDQTTKTVGALTEVRHRQLGIEGYTWSSSLDERVRPTHIQNEGQRFRWNSPPGQTGHPGQDVQCRCVAEPLVLQADRDRLKGE